MLHVTLRSMEVWSSYVCPVFGTLCDFMGNKLPSYEIISECLLLDKKKLLNGFRLQCVCGTAVPLELYEINEKKKQNVKLFTRIPG